MITAPVTPPRAAPVRDRVTDKRRALRSKCALIRKVHTMTKQTHTVALTIGRNIGTVPMAPHDWHAFKDAITATLAITYGTGNGRGEWDGVSEETFFAVGVVSDIDTVRAHLATLARTYHQDAIGCVAMAGTDSAVTA